jgi:NDP-sugar pyrophosphorylase family protein
MLAVVIAPGLCPGLKSLNERYPTPLLPLVDRPFIQHVVEFLVQQGITDFKFVLSHLPERMKQFLGDGSRWGSRFRYHLTKDPQCPYEMLKSLRLDQEEGPILLAQGDRLPQISLKGIEMRPPTPVAFCLAEPDQKDGEGTEWTGWALAPASFFAGGFQAATEAEMAQQVLAACPKGRSRAASPKMLDIRSYAGLIEAHRMVLDKAFEGLFLAGREADPGIWICRNVSLHPTARLLPPVFIGEDARIGSGTQLGPHVVIGQNCILDSGSSVAGSVVFPGSYVGEALELADVIVDKNRLINVRFGAAVSITDHFILGGITPKHLRGRLLSLLSMAMGTILLAILWPLILLTALLLKAFRKGPVRYTQEAVRIPASSDPGLWQTFSYWTFLPDRGEAAAKGGRLRAGFREIFLRALPSLIHVALGRMRIVGVAPRTREEILGLSDDWRALYLQAKAGIISEAFVHYGVHPNEDDLYSAEAFYSAMAGFKHDLSLFWGYWARVFGGSNP